MSVEEVRCRKITFYAVVHNPEKWVYRVINSKEPHMPPQAYAFDTRKKAEEYMQQYKPGIMERKKILVVERDSVYNYDSGKVVCYFKTEKEATVFMGDNENVSVKLLVAYDIDGVGLIDELVVEDNETSQFILEHILKI